MKYNNLALKILNVGDNDIYGRRFNGHDLSMYLRNLPSVSSANELVWIKRSQNQYVEEIAQNIKDRQYINHSIFNEIQNHYGLHGYFGAFANDLMYNKLFLNADIVHYHLIHNGFFDIKLLPILTKLKPSIWTLHDPWALTGHCIHFFDCNKWMNGCGNCPLLNTEFKIVHDSSSLDWTMKQTYFNASNFDIIVASHWMYDLVSKSPLFTGKKIHVIPFGIDLSIFKPDIKSNLRLKYNIPKDSFVVSCRASLWGLKGLSYIKQLLDMMPPKFVTIVTVNDIGLLDSFKSKFDIIEFGWVDDEKVLADFYALSDLFLMPSVAESFGLSALESMACGTPVITFEGTAVTEVIAHNIGGDVVKFGDISGLFDKIQLYKNNSELLVTRSLSARKLAEEKFDKDLYVSKVLDVYHEVISKFESSEQVNKVIDSQLKIKLIDSNIYKAFDPQLVSNNHNSSELEQIKNSRTYILAMRMKNNKCIRGAYFYLFRPLYRMLRKIKHSV